MLHLIGFPPADMALRDAITACLSEGDALVLLDHGLQWLDDDKQIDALIRLADKRRACVYALGENVTASIQIIDALGLVALTEQHRAISSWYL